MSHHVAQLNVARLLHPLDHEDSASFVSALEPINTLAEASPGFVWRLTDDEGGSSSYVEVPGIDDPLMIVNYSIWEDVESLRGFVYANAHSSYMRRRREWFEAHSELSTVCWWIRAGSVPGVAEAFERLIGIRRGGPSDSGWPLNRPLPAPSDT